MMPIEKNGKMEEHITKEFKFKEGQMGESVVAKMPKAKHRRCSFLEAHEMGFTRSTGSVSHSSKSENSLSEK